MGELSYFLGLVKYMRLYKFEYRYRPQPACNDKLVKNINQV